LTQINPPIGYTLLSQRLGRFGAFRKRWAWLNALAWFVILGPGSFLALVALDALVPLPWYLLLFLLVVAAGMTVYAAIVYALLPLLARIDIDREALVLESLHGNLDNQVIGSLQLGREVIEANSTGKSVGYSIAIASALVARTADNLDKMNLTALVSLKKAFRDLSIAGAVLLVWFVLLFAARPMLANRIDRIRDAYATLMDLLFPVNMVITPGDKSLVRGTPVSLGVEVAKARRTTVRLIRTDLKTKQVTNEQFTLDKDHKFQLDIPAAKESFTYEFEYGGRRSESHKILVGDVPSIAAMETELNFPDYTGMPVRTLIGRLPKIAALKGTSVVISIVSTVELDPKRSYVEFSDTTQPELTVSGRFAHFSFNVDSAKDGTLYLTGSLGKGFEMPDPVRFSVISQPDSPPTVQLLMSPKTRAQGATKTGVPMLVEEAAHFALSAIAEDDFGVDKMTLEYKIDKSDEHLESLSRHYPTEGEVPFSVEPSLNRRRPEHRPQDRVKHTFTDIFKELPPLVPGERVTINVSARDFNGGVGRSSPPFVFTVVRPDLGTYSEGQFGFDTDPLLGGLRRVQRATNLLIEAERTARTEAKATVEKQEVKSRAGAENWPGGSQDAVGDYFRLLSGEK